MESYSNILFLRDRNSIYMGILWRLLLHRGWNPTSWNLRGMKCEAFGNAADYSANREHPCSAYAKFSEKHISYSLIRTRTYVVYQEVKVCFFCFFLANFAYVLSEWSHILSKIYRHSGQSEPFKTLVGNCNFHFAKAAYFENIFSAYLLHTVGQSRIPVHSCRNIFIS